MRHQHPPAARLRQIARSLAWMAGGFLAERSEEGWKGKWRVIASQKQLLRAPVLPSKDATWYELQKYMQRHRHRSVARYRFAKHRYVATFAPAASLGRLAAHAVRTVGLQSQEQVVVADGAEWIKKQAQRHFPTATCILDWPHLWRTMIKAVRAVCTHKQQSEKWLAKQLALLGTVALAGRDPARRTHSCCSGKLSLEERRFPCCKKRSPICERSRSGSGPMSSGNNKAIRLAVALLNEPWPW